MKISNWKHSQREGARLGFPAINRISIEPGTRFSKWTVLGDSPLSTKKKRQVICRCECGNIRHVSLGNLRSGGSRSCRSCVTYRTDNYRRHGATVGGKSNPTYRCWTSMKTRCLNPLSDGFLRYGGQGVKICDRWRGDFGFDNFLADMGERPSLLHSIDRIDSAGSYEPSNCRWATAKEQVSNRRNTYRVEFNGECRPLTQWCELLGLPHKQTYNRILSGWDVSRALTQPFQVHRKREDGCIS